MPSDFSTDVTARRADICVAVAGEVDIVTSRSLAAALTSAAGQATTGDVLVDLARVTFADSTALRALVMAHVALAEQGRQLVLVALSTPVRRVIELAGLVTTFHIETDRAAPDDGAVRADQPDRADSC